MNIISLIMLLIACLNVFFLGKLVPSIVLIVITAVLLFVNLLFKKVLNKVAYAAINIIGLISFLVVSFSCGQKVSDIGLFAYEKSVNELESCAEEGDASEALDIVSELIEDYGENDKLLIYQANLLLMKDKPEKALDILSKVSANRGELFYILKANANYMLENYEEYTSLLMEGATKNYGSYVLNTSAGSMAAENGNYFGATYFLSRALEVNPEGALAAYSLAGVNYHAGNLEVAKELMDIAYKGGINDKSIYAEDELYIWYKEAR